MSKPTLRPRLLLGAVLIVVGLWACALPTGASASSAWWLLDSNFAPTNMSSGHEADITVTAVDAGYTEMTGAASEIKLIEKLPSGVEVKPGTESIEAEAGPQLEKGIHKKTLLTCTNTAGTIVCPYKGILLNSESIRLKVVVNVTAQAGTKLTNEVQVSGGKELKTVGGKQIEGEGVSAPEPLLRTTTVNEEPTQFGVENYELRPEEANGEIDTRAGSHPFQLSTSFDLTKTLIPHLREGKEPVKRISSPALAKNLHFLLPPGLIGNVAHMPQCSMADFNLFLTGGINLCTPETAVGVGSVSILEPTNLGNYTQTVPIFNLVPETGEPARFGFEIHDVFVVLTTSVRTGSDYAVEVSVHYATEAAVVLNSQITFWGVPGDSRHDEQRGWNCLDGGYFTEELEGEHPCVNHDKANPQALLTMPTVCGTNTPTSSVAGESWPVTGKSEAEPSTVYSLGDTYTFTSPFTECGKLKFQPEVEVEPTTKAASTPTGLNVTIKVPQSSTLSGSELGEADISQTKLALPVGMTASGGAANRLLTCSAEDVGFTGLGESLAGQLENDHFTPGPSNCPKQATVGTVKIITPLLEHELIGSVYLATVDTAPFQSPLVLYIVAEDETSGVRVKLAGEVETNPTTGQLTTTFKDTPPLPFSELKLHLFEGEDATQTTPPRCQTYAADASFLSSAGGEATREGQFAITSGPADEGGACPTGATLPFAPSVKAGVEETKGGAFAPFKVVLERPDGNQALKTITVHEPAGFAAMLSSVNPCPTAIAEEAEPKCPAESQIGVSTAQAGLGSEPVSISGKVYLTGPYHGAPFGLLSVTEAEHVGPFDLGNIPVMSTITVNETTAAATVTSNPIPQFAPIPGGKGGSTGVPSQIKKLQIEVNREHFTFNPTNCEAKSVLAVSTGYEGGVSESSRPFQASGCGSLPFKPSISVSVESNVSRIDGTGMKIVVKSSFGQANIHKTKLVFPNTVPSRLTTIQKACPDYVFEANPAGCDEGSVIGSAIARTPVLKSPLTGPVYLVSHANESFPDAVFVLQGEGIKLLLDGKTNIKDEVTSSTFETVPDAPVESFEVSLPRGPHSAFSGYGNLCEKPIEVPTTFGGQNGALIENETKVNVEGCGGVAPAKVESELAKLLKKCKKLTTKHGKRTKCEASARKQVAAVASCKKKYKGKAKKLASCEAAARKKYALKLK
jgi:hypothetical protein